MFIMQRQSQDLVASMTNVSHEVHKLTIGDPQTIRMVEKKKAVVPKGFEKTIQPMNGNVYITDVSAAN